MTLQNNNENEIHDESSVSSSVVIAAAMVNPKGKDSGNEWISLLNVSKSGSIMLQGGWKLQDQGGRNLILKENVVLKANATMTLKDINPLRLTNTGGSLLLYNPKG